MRKRERFLTTALDSRLAGRGPRRGITLLEVLLAVALLSFLSVLLSEAWSGFGRPIADLLAWSRVNHEANLAADCLARDLGGSLSEGEGRVGSKADARLVGRMQPTGTQLWLCFDGGPEPNGIADWGSPDTVIMYDVQDSTLLRQNQNTGESFVAARHLDRMELEDSADRLQIKLTLQYKTVTRTYTLIARDP
jgi:type II secretory pathway component PulJ